ncbi:hypothetical protein LAZ67_9001179 [Cordylochernes scorpioides]|uniref:Uncharacterized protein n=1 Tax=Cordylochernes scorpioides TaxID=51811 RepID=A0ABY6KTB9_9ARAC|nr:hypothetical protein LAZ67_9001179 [Cordylochernes scorpioides]
MLRHAMPLLPFQTCDCKLDKELMPLSAPHIPHMDMNLVEVYGEKCMDIKNVRKWCREFNEGRINVHDEQRSGRPSLPESTVVRIDEMVHANRRITREKIEDGLNEDCSHFSVHKIVSETLGYRKVSARRPSSFHTLPNLIWYDSWECNLGQSLNNNRQHVFYRRKIWRASRPWKQFNLANDEKPLGNECHVWSRIILLKYGCGQALKVRKDNTSNTTIGVLLKSEQKKTSENKVSNIFGPSSRMNGGKYKNLKAGKSYPITADNYPKVIAALKDRFGDGVILTEVYVRQLLGLVMNNARRKTIKIEHFYDNLESYLRSLESLGIIPEQKAAFLYPLVESSLPEDLITVW